MQRFARSHSGLVLLIILTFLLTACGGSATPVDCLEEAASKQWLKDVEALLAVWIDEAELVGLASRVTASEASRELRNIRRELRQMETPHCLTPMRDRILYQMTGALASLDAWIREDGAGLVFSRASQLNLYEFSDLFLADTTSGVKCREVLDAEWIRGTAVFLSDWEQEAKNLRRGQPPGSTARAMIAALEQDASSNCAKAAVLDPVLIWVREMQSTYDAVRETQDPVRYLLTSIRTIEHIDSIFLEVVNEYLDLHSNDSP